MRWFKKRYATSSWIKGKKFLPEKSLSRRQWEKFIIISLIVACVCLVLCRWLANGYRRHVFRLYNQPLKEIRWTTDGVLSVATLAPYITFPKGTGMMDIDIGALRSCLESLEQVRYAEIKRHFQDQSLQILLKEENPFARVILENQGEKEILWVEKNGKVFHVMNLTDVASRSLPFLAGLPIQRIESDGTYHFNCDITPIHDFLSQLKQEYPNIYSQICYLSLQHWDPEGNARWSRIEVTAKCAQKILFSSDYWEEQFRRLDYLLKEDYVKKHFPLRRIDLRFGPEVRIRLKHN
jgi:hypothetical protein